MKKILALLMAITLLFSLCACKKDGDVLSNNESDVTETVEFVKPEDYATVIGLKINPEFELYLDKEDNLLALNAVNEDAKVMEKDIDLSKKDLASVVSAIITKAQEKGYATQGGYMILKILDSNKTDETAILKKASDAAKKTFDELLMDFHIKTEEGEEEVVSDISSKEETSSKEDTSSKEETSSKVEESNKTDTSSKEETAENKPAAPTVLNPKTNIKKFEEYVGNKYSVEDDNHIIAGGISFEDDVAVLLSATFVLEGSEPDIPTSRTPVVYGGKKYYRCGSGFSPSSYELTDTEIIIKSFSDGSTVLSKMQLLSDGTLKVTYVSADEAWRFKVGDILSIEWNYLS